MERGRPSAGLSPRSQIGIGAGSAGWARMPVSSAGDIAGVGVGCLMTPISRPEPQSDAAQRRKVSPQTARRLIGQLGGSVTEISGQKRFRAWRL